MSDSIEDWTNAVHCVDAREALRDMPAESVDCMITSPPYYALRDYGEDVEADWGDGWTGQLGLEPTPDLYVDHLMEVFDAMQRVLKSSGVLWVNLDDKYAGGGGTAGKPDDWDDLHDDSVYPGLGPITPDGIQRKSLMAIPERFVLRMLDAGWCYRSRCAWTKPSAMPSSVKDRLNHRWEPLYMFSKEPMYWWDIDAVREPYSQTSKDRFDADFSGSTGKRGFPNESRENPYNIQENPRGKNPGDVLSVTNTGYGHAHYAVFPDELVRKPIKSSVPPKVCAACGTPYDRETETEYVNPGNRQVNSPKYEGRSHETPEFDKRLEAVHTPGEWEQACDCDPGETCSGVVLDPFAGRGTVGKVAKELDRRFVLLEIDPESVALAQEYTGIAVEDPEYLLDDESQTTLNKTNE